MAEAHEQRGCTRSRGVIALKWVCVVVVAALLSSMLSVQVEGAPILGPDLGSCKPVIPPRRTEADAVDCCFVDTGKPIKDFKFNTDLPIRVRRPAHKVDDEFIRKYERAYELMRALPATDPRSYEAQYKLHCSYCAAAYSQFNSTEEFDVHHGWLLLPFHRWFVYFHERILASLIGDDTFAIPYWAWDVQNETSPPANVMPSMYLNENSPLFDRLRCQIHLPPHKVDLKLNMGTQGNREASLMRNDNFFHLWRVMLSDTKSPEAFFGDRFVLGDPVGSNGGRFEMGPHAAVHGWTGDNTATFGEDMAPAYTAAKDPIFFAHHSQVDRLWTMWTDLGGQPFDDPDWLDAEFLFYDENGDMVRVNIRDSLDFEKFRVSYEQLPVDWLDYTPRSIRGTDPKYPRSGIVGRLWRQLLEGEMLRNMAVTLGSIFRREVQGTAVVWGERSALTSRLFRPKVSSQSGMVESISRSNASLVYDEVLVISGVVKKPFDAMVFFNLFLELPEADESTPLDCAESLGDVYLEPEGLRTGGDRSVTRKFSHVIGIGDRLRILDRSHHNAVTVTFVPAWESQYDSDISVSFTELKIEFKLARW